MLYQSKIVQRGHPNPSVISLSNMDAILQLLHSSPRLRESISSMLVCHQSQISDTDHKCYEDRRRLRNIITILLDHIDAWRSSREAQWRGSKFSTSCLRDLHYLYPVFELQVPAVFSNPTVHSDPAEAWRKIMDILVVPNANHPPTNPTRSVVAESRDMLKTFNHPPSSALAADVCHQVVLESQRMSYDLLALEDYDKAIDRTWRHDSTITVQVHYEDECEVPLESLIPSICYDRLVEKADDTRDSKVECFHEYTRITRLPSFLVFTMFRRQTASGNGGSIKTNDTPIKLPHDLDMAPYLVSELPSMRRDGVPLSTVFFGESSDLKYRLKGAIYYADSKYMFYSLTEQGTWVSFDTMHSHPSSDGMDNTQVSSASYISC